MPLENTPTLYTERLLLRRFRETDTAALYALLRDEEVNTFLPWFPLRTPDEAARFLRERFLAGYERPAGYRYAVCRREDDRPIGYICLAEDESHDFGYALRREDWGRGIVTEAAQAVVERIRQSGCPFITATHDVHNPRSGAVMQKLGMTYRYSYVEQWQPKDVAVTFRMYQLNFDGRDDCTYRGYWDRYERHFVEQGLDRPGGL